MLDTPAEAVRRNEKLQMSMVDYNSVKATYQRFKRNAMGMKITNELTEEDLIPPTGASQGAQFEAVSLINQ